MKTAPIYTIAIVVLLQFCFFSCISTKRTVTSSNQISSSDSSIKTSHASANYPTELTDYLKSFTCLEVKGNDVFGEVRIKGMGQITARKGPLFVVNDIRMGHDLSQIASFLDVDEIAQIKVLRHPAEIGIYGSAANNGVILIKLME
jgi:hypothetical protein